ncbi:FAD binding domain protein [Hypoxylon sp. FL1284]|nr:FAD binding domain protein [Hypoxylon sp. FL1284]
MEVLTALTAWAIGSVCRSIPPDHWLAPVCPAGHFGRADLSDLTARLSSNAAIYYPGSEGFEKATMRFSSFHSPGVNVVVVPSVAADVAETVIYANEKDMPFVAITGGHGAITTMGRLENGIQIWMDMLSSVEIAEDGATAKIGGGALSKTVIESLWSAGKQTVTGCCECTSLLGPGLGGGHGWLQGRYGLISDQFQSVEIVLADGSLRTVDESSDLWWAIQGAGHNFGIVTSVTMKVYDIKHRDWAYEMFVFTGDQVEGLYGSFNGILNGGSPPVDIITYGLLLNEPSISTTGPVTMVWVFQEGSTSVDSAYTKALHALGPTAVDAGNGNYLDLARWGGMSIADMPCQKSDFASTRFPVDVQSYDVQAMRKVYDRFASATKETPALNGSFLMAEGYSLRGVKAVPSDSTAFAFRDANFLIAPVIRWPPSGPEVAQKGVDLGKELRQIVHEATGEPELHTYVNYAFGDETPQNCYGYEQWRQDRLRDLKQKYDPQNKFRFYAPIA